MRSLQASKNYFLSGGQLKINFDVLNNFTKQGTRQNMLGFRGDGVLASETAKVKSWNYITETIQSIIRF
jgi:hypothetical protein